ncbi:hypothetical protein [Halococcoides cellulosivorans]|uniref:Uncharacterized protein n=1 Tax=Halococcoides cellulosivorans TaxID=1679096 RepID=A0A2R4X185_9EURY|nr:hypothetical protein [Halococcoides cellulosivorans]AWB27546.1 hypothetical protein HARCEL1_07405 [Halococcoides cellulosivorans]
MDERARSTLDTDDHVDTPPQTTRRAVLTAGGTIALGGLAGCVAVDGLWDRASERAIGTTSASPASFYSGGAIDDVTAYRSGPIDVRFVPPTLRAESRRIDIDGWSTSAATNAQDYNSSRSNKPRTTYWPDPDSDGDGISTLVTVLDIERSLVVYADAAIGAIEERSADDATAALDAFVDATTAVQAALDGCPTELCRTVSDHADGRKDLARDATDAVSAGRWDSARRSIQQARRIVQSDIDRIHDDLDSDGDGLPDATKSLYEYLDGEPTIAEQFVVSLPDTRVPDGPALESELTPKRVLEYFTGDRNAEGCADSDRAAAVHRDLACRDLLTATIALDGGDLDQHRDIDTKDIRRGVAAFGTTSGVVVTGASPAAAVAEPMARVTSDCCAADTCCFDYDSWGEEITAGAATVTPTFVVPVVATPPDCPSPIPALLYVRRIRHDDQLLYVGGWHIDDGALYENSATLLVADGPNVVAGVTRSDIEDGAIDLVKMASDDRVVRKKPGRTKYATATVTGRYDPDAEYLPAGAHSVCRSDGDLYCWGVQSREALATHDTTDCDDRDPDVRPSAVTTALDAPVLHLVEAGDASNDVKFKAGAELSKSVN